MRFIFIFLLFFTFQGYGQQGSFVMLNSVMCSFDTVTSQLDTFAIMPQGNRCEIQWTCDTISFEFFSGTGMSLNKFDFGVYELEWMASFTCEGIVRYRVMVDGEREIVLWMDGAEMAGLTILNHKELVVLFLEP